VNEISRYLKEINDRNFRQCHSKRVLLAAVLLDFLIRSKIDNTTCLHGKRE
jgi:hypothetical protein